MGMRLRVTRAGSQEGTLLGMEGRATTSGPAVPKAQNGRGDRCNGPLSPTLSPASQGRGGVPQAHFARPILNNPLRLRRLGLRRRLGRLRRGPPQHVEAATGLEVLVLAREDGDQV